MTWQPVTYRDIHADSLRLIIDGKDYTRFRGVPAQIGGYQLQEPFGYGPADFAIPAVSGFEYTPSLGLPDEIRHLREGTLVRLVPVTNGVRGHDIWRGIITRPNPTTRDGLLLHCDGEASGRLELTNKQPRLFFHKTDLGYTVARKFGSVGLPFAPTPETGIIRENRGGGTTNLGFINELLAEAITADGVQWTVEPEWVNGRHRYNLALKDTATVHATVFYGAEGVDLDVSSDIQEKPTTWYGAGIAPDGQKWINPIVPGLEQGEPAPYPFNDKRTFGVGTSDADTDTGDGIAVMHHRLTGHGYLDEEDIAGKVGLWGAATTEAVEDVQEVAGLPVTGTVNPATWDALFDVAALGLSLGKARIMPLVQDKAVRQWDRTSSGARKSRNPDYDRNVIEVDRNTDHGAGATKRQARQWTRRQRKIIRQNGEIWTGTLALAGADVFEGDVDAATADPVPMSRLKLVQGMNVKVVGFDGDRLFHISGANFDQDLNVRYAVDTAARDLLTVGQIIARRKESRRNPAREFLQSLRRPTAFESSIIWSEIGGKLYSNVNLTGGEWNQFEVVAGQSGTVERIRLQLINSKCEYVVAVSALSAEGWLRANVGNPFDQLRDGVDISEWAKATVTRRFIRERGGLEQWGTHEQPCGYSPGKKTDTSDLPAWVIPDSITGEFEDEAGFAYHCQGDPVLYINIFPRLDCTVKAGRIMWPLQTEGS